MAAWKAAVAARDAVRMQALLDFAKRDATDEMFEAIKKLWAFRREVRDSGGLLDWRLCDERYCRLF